MRPWPLVSFFQTSLKSSELITTHNTFRDTRVHFFHTTFPEIAVYAALCTDPALACVSRRCVRLLFHLPKNKATAGEKAASQVGWWRHRKWFSPHVAVVTPLHSEILKSLLSGPWTTSFQAFSVNAFRWRIRDEKNSLGTGDPRPIGRGIMRPRD